MGGKGGKEGTWIKEGIGGVGVRKRSLPLQSLSNSLLIARHSFCWTLINRGESGSASLFNQRLLFKDLGDSTRAPRGSRAEVTAGGKLLEMLGGEKV